MHDSENFTEHLTVAEEAHEFVTELKEPGKYKLSVTTFSSSGSCETRKSQSAKSLSFYISKYQGDHASPTGGLGQWNWWDWWCPGMNYSSDLRDTENSSRSGESQSHATLRAEEIYVCFIIANLPIYLKDFFIIVIIAHFLSWPFTVATQTQRTWTHSLGNMTHV